MSFSHLRAFSCARVLDRKRKDGLITEHLSRIDAPDGRLFGLDLRTDHGEEFRGANFVNVGLWRSKKDFEEETERGRSDPAIKKQLDRTGAIVIGRALLSPVRVTDGVCKRRLGDITFVE